jgi:hypothetical protein
VSFVVDESLFYIGAYLTGKKKRRQVGLHAYSNNEQYALVFSALFFLIRTKKE